MVTINGFNLEMFVREGEMFIQISSRKARQIEALYSKVKEWVQ